MMLNILIEKSRRGVGSDKAFRGLDRCVKIYLCHSNGWGWNLDFFEYHCHLAYFAIVPCCVLLELLAGWPGCSIHA